MLKIKRPKPERKTYVQLLKEAWKCKSGREAQQWLEKEALILKRRNPGYTISGAKFLIRMNLDALAVKYDATTVKHVRKLFGKVRPMFGAAHYDRRDVL